MTESRVDEGFLRLADPYRRELLAHCYRMLGSVHDAEDLVQETYLRAWRAYERFEGRSSLRTWLYRIATRTCLTALESRNRRPLPTAAVNSALQRARAQLDEVAPSEDEIVEPTDSDQRALLDRFVAAFEDKDIGAIVELFTKDAVWEMPPFVGWYQGADTIARLIDTHCPADGKGAMRLLPIHANGQPAFGLYMRDGDVYRAFNMPVLSIVDGRVTHVACFFDTALFETFGLPPVLPARAAP